MAAEDTVNLGQLFAEYERTSQVTVLPAGKHKLRVIRAVPKNKGIQPVFRIEEGPDIGKTAMAGGIFPGDTEGGRQAFFRKLEKFGLKKEFFQQNPTLKDTADALVNRVIIADLTVGSWNDEPRNELGFGIELIEAPPLPAVGGVPQVAATAPRVETVAPPVPASIPNVEPSAPPVIDDDPGF